MSTVEHLRGRFHFFGLKNKIDFRPRNLFRTMMIDEAQNALVFEIEFAGFDFPDTNVYRLSDVVVAVFPEAITGKNLICAVTLAQTCKELYTLMKLCVPYMRSVYMGTLNSPLEDFTLRGGNSTDQFARFSGATDNDVRAFIQRTKAGYPLAISLSFRNFLMGIAGLDNEDASLNEVHKYIKAMTAQAADINTVKRLWNLNLSRRPQDMRYYEFCDAPMDLMWRLRREKECDEWLEEIEDLSIYIEDYLKQFRDLFDDSCAFYMFCHRFTLEMFISLPPTRLLMWHFEAFLMGLGGIEEMMYYHDFTHINLGSRRYFGSAGSPAKFDYAADIWINLLIDMDLIDTFNHVFHVLVNCKYFAMRLARALKLNGIVCDLERGKVPVSEGEEFLKEYLMSGYAEDENYRNSYPNFVIVSVDPYYMDDWAEEDDDGIGNNRYITAYGYNVEEYDYDERESNFIPPLPNFIYDSDSDDAFYARLGEEMMESLRRDPDSDPERERLAEEYLSRF